MSSRIGIQEKVSIYRGSAIEVSTENEFGNVWICAILDKNIAKNIAKSKDLRFPVRYVDPLSKEDFEPPMIHTTLYRFIRPVPPEDFFPDVGFEEGDVIDAVHNGGWWCGLVIKKLANRRYLVYRKYDSDVFEVDEKDLRRHLVWKDEEWFRCERQHMVDSEFSVGKSVEVRTEKDNMGDVWTPAIVIKENEDGTLLVKLKILSNKEDIRTKFTVPYSEIRPSQPGFGYGIYKFMEKVNVFLNSRWFPGIVSKVLSGNQYGVVLGQNKESKEFDHYQLRPSIEWKDGVWITEEKVLDREESSHEGKTSPFLRDQKNVLATGKELRGTQSMKNQKGSANDSDGEKGPEEATDREIVNKRKRGRAGKLMSTEPKQKTGVADNGSKVATFELANMSDDDSPLAMWIHGEQTSSGLAGLSAGQSVCRSPEPLLNSVMEKHVDVVETTPAKESTMVLPVAKNSSTWKVLESVEVFKAGTQDPPFTPILESLEESREEEAICQIVMCGLLQILNDLQVDEPISSIIRIDECLLKLEKHGFNVRELRSWIAKLLSIKEAQTKALEEFKVVEEQISERGSERRKYEEDIVELQRREAMLKEAKVRVDTDIAQKERLNKEIARMQSQVAALDQKVQNIDEEFRAIVTALIS